MVWSFFRSFIWRWKSNLRQVLAFPSTRSKEIRWRVYANDRRGKPRRYRTLVNMNLEPGVAAIGCAQKFLAPACWKLPERTTPRSNLYRNSHRSCSGSSATMQVLAASHSGKMFRCSCFWYLSICWFFSIFVENRALRCAIILWKLFSDAAATSWELFAELQAAAPGQFIDHILAGLMRSKRKSSLISIFRRCWVRSSRTLQKCIFHLKRDKHSLSITWWGPLSQVLISESSNLSGSIILFLYSLIFQEVTFLHARQYTSIRSGERLCQSSKSGSIIASPCATFVSYSPQKQRSRTYASKRSSKSLQNDKSIFRW